MNFIKYDANTGVILSSGDMPEGSIDYLNEQGQNLLKTYDTSYSVKDFKVNLQTMTVEPVDIAGTTLLPIMGLENTIKSELQKSDYTQTVDAIDHITPEVIDAWRQYRILLRNALNQPDYFTMVMVLPTLDPTGKDPFAFYRGFALPPFPGNTSNSGVTVTFSNQ